MMEELQGGDRMLKRIKELEQLKATTCLQRRERKFEDDDVGDLPVLPHGSPFDFIRKKVPEEKHLMLTRP